MSFDPGSRNSSASAQPARTERNMIGQSISHYRIIGKLGAGGMGEVYRAEDVNLHRHVAIKVLPDEFARDAERLARFEREAKLLASLNHPNIAAIHGLEEHEGKRFLVLELVEGQTLAERLKKGRIPLDETLDICRQIAEGLEAAHEKGIIHRDLKPANVKVTPEGKVKVLDFGVAKAFHEGAVPADVSKFPTLTRQMTHAGVILGTAVYMSPEQTRGKPVDRRADIWAFGCVLYECLTGKRAFHGDTSTEAMAAILKEEPDWTLLPAATPAVVRLLLRRCLQKDPARRLHDIVDARVEMLEGLSEPGEAIPVAHRFPPGWVLSVATAALVIGVVIGLVAMKHARPIPSASVVRSIIKVEPGQWLAGMGRVVEFWRPSRTAMAISGDGQFIVYSAIEANPGPQAVSRLYIRRTALIDGKPIAGTEGGISPFLSPDDRWIGFWATGRLMKVPVEGGVPAALCDVPLPFGFSWGSENQIVFASSGDSGLSIVSADGGKPGVLTIPDKSKGEYGHRLPHYLPTGKAIVFTITEDYLDVRPRLAALELATRKWRVLLEDAADARYVASGHLVFLRQGTLMVVPFNPDTLEVKGQPVPAVVNVLQALNVINMGYNTGSGQFSVSASGSLAYAPGGTLPDAQDSLVWVNTKGESAPIASFEAPFFAPRFSPDGQRIAYRTAGKENHVWVYDLNRGTSTKLTSEGYANWVTWTPDGQRLVFGWSKAGIRDVFWQPADGSSPMERLTQREYNQYPGSWSPDGETLAFVQGHPVSGSDILLFQMRDRKVSPFLNSEFDEMSPEFSPDGRWMVYVSNESGRNEVYVRQFPGPGGRWQISSEGGTEPLWSRNGRQLFFRRGNQVLVVDVKAGTGFSGGRPRLVFEQPGFWDSLPIRCWDISPDGMRFVMVKLGERKPQPVTKMILVQNWLEELKLLCPTGK